MPIYRHYGLYAYRTSFLRAYPTLAPSPIERYEALEQLRALWHGYRIVVEVTHGTPAPGIDTPEDLARVRVLYACGLRELSRPCIAARLRAASAPAGSSACSRP